MHVSVGVSRFLACHVTHSHTSFTFDNLFLTLNEYDNGYLLETPAH